MLNNLILVGRLARDISVNKTENGRHIGNLCLAIPRTFKNMEGIYETDFINCILWEEKAMIAKEYCQKGDILGVKGRLQSRIIETKEGNRNILEVIAERVVFLTKKEVPKEASNVLEEKKLETEES